VVFFSAWSRKFVSLELHSLISIGRGRGPELLAQLRGDVFEVAAFIERAGRPRAQLMPSSALFE
jgi:hypothetical protein